jgi:signal transduction histidine kinase
VRAGRGKKPSPPSKPERPAASAPRLERAKPDAKPGAKPRAKLAPKPGAKVAAKPDAELATNLNAEPGPRVGAAEPERAESSPEPTAPAGAHADAAPADGREPEELAAAKRTIAELRAAEVANTELRTLTQNLDQIIRQRTRVLAESEAQLRRQNVELERLNRVKSEFISIAAHELRTPMTSIVGYLDMIAEGRLGELPADLKRPMASLRRNAHRLRRLVEDLLDASRIDSGRVSLVRQAVSLGDIVAAVIDEMRPFVVGKHQTVVTQVSSTAPIDGDADKLHQVVSNLVANSWKYTPEGGEIRLSVDSDGDSAVLRVWDNGIGIPEALRSRIFEPFSDVHTAKHHTSIGPDSAGLGLYIARGIVELHGGSIAVDSEEGRFSEFTVRLPLWRGA